MMVLWRQQFGLAFVAGYCDTVGFIALGGLFVAHVTGNLVLAGASVFGAGSAAVVPNLLMLPVFVLSIGALTLGAGTDWFQGKPVARKTQILLVFQLAFSLAFWAAGAATQHAIRSVAAIAIVGTLGVIALAAQNAMTRLTGTTAPATTVMTGNLTQAAVSWFSMLSLPRGQARDSQARQLRTLAPSVLGFFTGAASAAPLTHYLGFHSMSVACAAIVALVVSYRT